MGAVVLSHIDELLGLCGPAEGGLADRTGFSYKSDDGAVGGLSGIYIQHFDTFYGTNGLYNSLYYALIFSFAVVGNAFDELFHGFSSNYALKIAKKCISLSNE